VQVDPFYEPYYQADAWQVIEGNPPAEVRATALAELERFMAPAPQPALERWLVELSLITSRRQDDTATEALRLAAYSDRLAAYPSDVAREALLVHTWQWWPSWHELKQVCDEIVRPRRQVQNALTYWPEEEAERRERNRRLAEERRRKQRAERERNCNGACYGCPDDCAFRAEGAEREAAREAEQAAWGAAVEAELAAEEAEREAAGCYADSGCAGCAYPETCAAIRTRRARDAERKAN
jgi:hypothetical protein